MRIKDKPVVAGHKNLNIYTYNIVFISSGKREDDLSRFIYLLEKYIQN